MLPTCFKGRLPVTEFGHIFSDSCTGLKIIVMAMMKVSMGMGESCDSDVWVVTQPYPRDKVPSNRMLLDNGTAHAHHT